MDNKVIYIYFLKSRVWAEIPVPGKLLCSLNLSHDFFSIYWDVIGPNGQFQLPSAAAW